MCGRLALTEMPWTYISELWLDGVELDAQDMPQMKGAVMHALDEHVAGFQPRYNIAPSQQILTIRSGRSLGQLGDPRDNYQVSMLRWGMIPSWAQQRNVGQRLINARAESLLDKPAFRRPLRKQRCLIVASGFYEWERIGKVRQPFLFSHQQQDVFFIAGLWDQWTASPQEVIESCTIITTEANTIVSPIHDRMPTILSLEQACAWLDPNTSLDELAALARQTYSPQFMDATRVESLVNDVSNEGPDCQKPLQLDMIQQLHRRERKKLEDQSVQSTLPFLSTGS